MRRFFLIGLLVGLVLAVTLRAQPLPPNIQIAINNLTTGITPFSQLQMNEDAYISWDSPSGANGYGIRDNNGVMEFKDAGGSWTPVSSGSGAPSNASYWVRIPNSSLTNETPLGSLATGLIINTTTTGVPTIYGGVTCTNQFLRVLSAVGAGTCASVGPSDFLGTLPVNKGGTGIAAGTSGGILAFSGASTIVSSGLLAANRLVVGGGSGVAPSTIASLGTTTTVLHGNASGAPTFSAVSLTADVSGILPGLNGGTGNGFMAFTGPATTLKTFTLPNASATILTDGTPVTPAQGGTGFSSYTIGDILQASGATTLAKLAAVATGNAFISGGVATVGSWGKIGLTTHISGTLLATNGGTGIASYAVGDLLYASSTTALAKLAIGAASTVLTSNGTTASWAVGPAACGMNTYIQFNDMGGCGSSADFTFDDATDALTLGSAGVRLTPDGDGALTFLGLGNGSDEDLTFNFDDVANTVGVSSSTGVGNFSSTIGWYIDVTADVSGSAIPLEVSADQYGNAAKFGMYPSASYGSASAVEVLVRPSSGDYTDLRGILLNASNTGMGTVTNYEAVRISNPSAGAYTNVYGIRIDTLSTGVTINYPFYYDGASNDTTINALGVVTGQLATNGTTPSVANVGANSCGTTAASITGNSNSGRVTVGATSGTQCRVTTTITAPNGWNCAVSNTGTAALARCVGVDTTHFDLVGVFTAADVLAYVALPN